MGFSGDPHGKWRYDFDQSRPMAAQRRDALVLSEMQEPWRKASIAAAGERNARIRMSRIRDAHGRERVVPEMHEEYQAKKFGGAAVPSYARTAMLEADADGYLWRKAAGEWEATGHNHIGERAPWGSPCRGCG